VLVRCSLETGPAHQIQLAGICERHAWLLEDSRQLDNMYGKGTGTSCMSLLCLCCRYFQEGADEVAFLNITGFRDCPLEDLPMLQVSQLLCFYLVTDSCGVPGNGTVIVTDWFFH
jgi:hypothetical protein